MKKCLVALLVACLLLPLLVACNLSSNDPISWDSLPSDSQSTESQTDSDTVKEPGESTGSGTTGTSDSSNSSSSGGNTQEEHRFNGAEFKILTQSPLRDFSVEQQGSTPIERAVYTRNKAMEERFDVKLVTQAVNGDGRNDLYNAYLLQINSSYENFSLVTGKLKWCADMSVQGFTYNLRQLPALKLTEDWWFHSAHETYGIGEQLHVALGDATHTIYENMEVVFVNETLARTHLKNADETPVDLYDLVETGHWTWESFVLFTESVPTGDVGAPTYGLVTNDAGAIALPTGMGVTVAQMQSNERWGFGATTDAQLRYDHVKALLTQKEQVYYNLNETDSETVGDQLFTAGRALFYTQRLGAGAALRSGMPQGHTMGILPYPAADVGSGAYRTPLREEVPALTVPKNVKNAEMAGVVLEEFARYGYENLRPEQWNAAWEGYIADADHQAMLKTIREGVTASFDMAYSQNLHDSYSIVPGMIGADQSFADYYNAKVGTWRKNLPDLYVMLS